MKTIYDVMTQAIDGIDEKYLEKTAECLSVPKKASKRSVIINSEELVEMKDKSKKSDFIAKIVAVAAAFMCVMAVSVFLIVNNNNKEIEELKQRMKALEEGTEDTIAAINDLSEDTRKELDDIYLALSQLAEKQKQITKKNERKPIGFVQYKTND